MYTDMSFCPYLRMNVCIQLSVRALMPGERGLREQIREDGKVATMLRVG